MSRSRKVASASELLEVAADPDIAHIEVVERVEDLPSIRLGPGQSLQASGSGALIFATGVDGLQVSADNRVEDVTIVTDPDRCALHNDTSQPGFGRLTLRRLKLTGCLRLVAEKEARSGHLVAHDIQIPAADATSYPERPSGFGVEVIPGAFLVWNRQPAADALVTAELDGIGVGRAGAPVRGSGIFLAGTPGGGRMLVTRLVTDEVHSHGGIAPGTADRIAGGVFVVSGAHAFRVHNRGAVTTYGPNDMVLDNWGSVDTWQADARITSHGPSAIGFVNFGDLDTLTVDAPIETFGEGARGFNVYDGTLGTASFDQIATHGGGAVGVQISRRVGSILVRRGLETFGGTGDSLVKGVVTPLAAIPLSIKPGGSAEEVRILGGLVSHGAGVTPFELHGEIRRFVVEGDFSAAGGGFAAI